MIVDQFDSFEDAVKRMTRFIVVAHINNSGHTKEIRSSPLPNTVFEAMRTRIEEFVDGLIPSMDIWHKETGVLTIIPREGLVQIQLVLA